MRLLNQLHLFEHRKTLRQIGLRGRKIPRRARRIAEEVTNDRKLSRHTDARGDLSKRCHMDAYCRATRMGIRPRPERSGASALPITAPNARPESVAFIAWPTVEDVVSRSPTAIGVNSASTWKPTRPESAIGSRVPPL